MPDDVGAIQIAAGVFGTVSAAFLVFLQVQAIKTFVPRMAGTIAVAAVYVVSALTSLIVLIQAGVNLRSSEGLIAWYVGMLALGLIAQGIYAELFKVSVSGAPPSADASVNPADINDPHHDPTQRTSEQPRVRVERHVE